MQDFVTLPATDQTAVFHFFLSASMQQLFLFIKVLFRFFINYWVCGNEKKKMHFRNLNLCVNAALLLWDLVDFSLHY